MSNTIERFLFRAELFEGRAFSSMWHRAPTPSNQQRCNKIKSVKLPLNAVKDTKEPSKRESTEQPALTLRESPRASPRVFFRVKGYSLCQAKINSNSHLMLVTMSTNFGQIHHRVFWLLFFFKQNQKQNTNQFLYNPGWKIPTAKLVPATETHQQLVALTNPEDLRRRKAQLRRQQGEVEEEGAPSSLHTAPGARPPRASAP